MNKVLQYIFIVLFVITAKQTAAQTYGNEWIQYNQKYYSFKVYPPTLPLYFGDVNGVETGIHKIDYDLLNNSGVPLGTFNSENIQIFGREKEIPLWIEDGGDSSIDPGDYILFYTERNDGWLDSNLYNDVNSIGNPYYSLYNDTLEYFFTWNGATNNLRYLEEDNVDYPSYTPSNYIWYNRWHSNTGGFAEGEQINSASSSFYTSGEGWSSNKINGASGYTWNASSVEIKHPYQGAGAPDVYFKGMQVGLSNADYTGMGNHHVQWTIGASDYIFVDSIWIGYKGIRLSSTIPIATLPATGVTNLKIHIIPDQGALTDYQSISNWNFQYPRMPIFDGENRIEFRVPNNLSEAKVRLDISNISYNSPIVFVHGDVIPKKIKVSPNGGLYTTLVSNSTNGTDQHIVYQDSSTIKIVDTLIAVNGNGSFTDFSSIPNLDNALLMVYHPKLQSASDNYVTYRSSSAGGNYNVISANVNELYQQFGGGIEKHINGIRRFTHFIYNQATFKPVGLFLMGKGIREATIGSTPGTRRNETYFHESLIPSFGQPPSDICISSNLEGLYKWAPLAPTGRISARTNAELQSYLDKVVEFDIEQDPNDIYDSPNKDWQKQVIHFAGGSDIIQQGQFSAIMNNLSTKIEDSLYAGNVMKVYKSSSDPLDPTILASVTDRIQEGVSLMSYFGHASATNSGFEVNLDEPSNWNNSGKYPLMVVNSCYNGNIFQYNNSKSEDFVQIPSMGAIGYIASTNVGFASYLSSYSHRLYDQFRYFGYGKSIGEQMKNTIEILETPFADLYLETTCTQMVLNGDPMLKLNSHERPEIELLAEYVSFSPENIDLSVDSIEMHIDLKNLGRSVTDTFSLEIIRDFPSSDIDSVYHFEIPFLNYKKEFSFKMPLQANIGLGLNNFSITVDLPTVIDEQYDEVGNNQVTNKTLLIDIDGIIPVIPYEFAVVPEDSVTVRASTSNPIADFNTYRFEIDTIDFEGAVSPAHRFAIVSGYGGVKEVNPSEWTLTSSPSSDGTLMCEDSVVYFWRVSIDGDTIWNESSFQYIQGKSGWGQDHFFQFKRNDFSGLEYNRPTRLRNFIQDDKTISCDVFNGTSGSEYNAYYINGNQEEYGICTYSPRLYVAVIDPITHTPWGTRYGTENPTHNFGNVNDNGACRPRVEDYFIYQQNNGVSLTAFQNLVNNIVPDGHYILIYTPLQASYTAWDAIDPGMYTTFAALGSDSIYTGRPNLPFAFFCRKGDTSSVVEYCSQDFTDDFTLNAILEGYDNVGREHTPLIGPSTYWRNVYWKQDPLEVGSLDTTILTINAYDFNGSLQYSIDTTFTLNDSILNLNSLIDANLYPYIDFSAKYIDTTTFTPAQIDRWHVLFDPVPEAAIDGSTLFTWSASSDVMEGDSIEFAVDVKNIFSVDMDSLLISYWVEDANHNMLPIAYPRQDSLKVNETLRDTIKFSTGGMLGLNSLWMEVNPYINGSLYETDQPEQAHFNNILQIPFTISHDTINPILDVTFNGNHILNGDIVDPNSEILITLKDDNDFLIMDDISDTTLFGVYLTNPLGNLVKIPFVDGVGNTVMQWTPATSQNKRFKIVWPADFTMDGTYTLLVQGADKSGNLSGDLKYRVNFEIIHESSITHMMNYPNPFSTSTRFVFTLTGSDEPDDIIIQILTVTGRVVREITEDELGLIQIGRNITEFAWDGTDEFGDPLANGVYLYRVLAKINGEDIKHRDSGADSHFKKDFGKMYLLR